MKIGRRHFIQAAALCAAPIAPAQAAPAAGPHALDAAHAHGVVFRITGWEAVGDAPADIVAEVGSDAVSGAPAWVGVSRSWRASWR